MNGTGRRFWIALAAITALGLGLRLWSATSESIFLDEVSLNWLVSGRPFGSMVDQVTATENSPILGFALAWLSSRIGSSPEWIRLPSMLAGTLTIPVTGLLGRRAFDARVGLISAAFAAAAPMLVFFSVEARPYSIGCLMVAVAALLIARVGAERQPRAWVWPGFAIAIAAAMLSHYTAIFAVAVTIAWALFAIPTARKRTLAWTAVAAGIFCAAWLGHFLTQYGHSDVQVKFTKFIAPLSIATLAKMAGMLVAGRPLVGLGEVPGPVLGAVIAICLAVAAAAAIATVVRLPGASRSGSVAAFARGPAGLLVAIVLIQPVGLIVSGIIQDGSFLLARNAIYVLPGLLVLVAGSLSTLPRAAAVEISAILCGALAAASIVGISSWPRPDNRGAADAIAARWKPGDLVVEQTFSANPQNDGDITPYLPESVAKSFRFAEEAAGSAADATIVKAFEQTRRRGASVFVTAADTIPPPSPAGPPPALGRSFRLVWSTQLKGVGRIRIVQWQRTG